MTEKTFKVGDRVRVIYEGTLIAFYDDTSARVVGDRNPYNYAVPSGSVIEVIEPRPSLADLERVLLELPQDPDLIAVKLGQLKIKGGRKSALSCPLARYLNRVLGVGTSVAVDRARLLSGIDYSASHPKGVCEFIHNHDSGLYPWLDEDDK